MNNNQLEFKFKASNNKLYKVDAIWDSTIYIKKSIIWKLPELYYLVLWKGYFKEKIFKNLY